MRFYSSIAFRISAFVAVTILLVIMALSNFVLDRMTQDYLFNLSEQADNLADVVSLYNLEAIIIRDYSFLVGSLERLLAHEPLGLEFVALSGMDGERLLQMGNYVDDTSRYYSIRTPVDGYNTQWAYLDMQFSLARLYASLDAASRYIRFAATLAVACAVLLTLLATYRFVRPLKQLTDQAYRISQGQLDQQIQVRSSDETQVLASALEGMRVRFRQFVSEAVSKAMVWEGKFEYLHLAQLLNLLRVTGRSGGLMVHSQGKTGLIHVRDGEIVHCLIGSKTGREALTAAIRWESGDFKFDPNLDVTVGNMSGDWTEQMLTAAHNGLANAAIHRFVPDAQFVAKPVSAFDTDRRKRCLSTTESAVFSLCDGQRDVVEIAGELQRNIDSVTRDLVTLIVTGFVQTDPIPVRNERSLNNVIPLWKRARH